MGFKGKVYVADDGEEPNLPVITLAQAGTIFTRITNYYTDSAARTTETAVPSKMSLAEKTGMQCWVDSVEAYSFYTGTEWKWVPQYNVLFDEPRASAANSTGTSPISIILTPTLTLPPGNRRLQVTAMVTMTNLSATAGHIHAYVTGLGTGVNLMQNWLALNETETEQRTWDVVASGSVSYDLQGKSLSGSVNASFTYSNLLIVDLGPA